MKKTILIFTALIIMFIGLGTVSAVEKTSENIYEISDTMQILANNSDCDSMFGDPDKPGDLAYYLQKILDIIKYAGVILCIFLTIVDFAKAILGEDKEMYKPLAKTAFNRLCYAVMLFFLPAVVKTLLTLIDVYGTCGLS